MRSPSISFTFSWHNSARRIPVENSVISIARWNRLLAASVHRAASSGLRTMLQSDVAHRAERRKDKGVFDSRDRACVLITGGAGYIGSHSAKALVGAGFYPVVVDDLRTGHRSAIRWGPHIKIDLADKAALSRVFETYSIAAVMHFAGSAYVGESMDAPQLYFQVPVPKV
jgi:hypothetical protein